MRYWLSAVLLGLLASSASAQQDIRWAQTLDIAKRAAAQTNKLVLVHFWAEWCKPCMKMERDVFSQAEVAAALERDFVCVKIRPDQFPFTAKEYGVTTIPADVVITPQGQLVSRLMGAVASTEYIGRLNKVAMDFRARNAQQYAWTPSAPPAAGSNRSGPGVNVRPSAPPGQPAQPAQPSQPAQPPSNATRYSNDRYADYLNRQAPPVASPVGPRYGALALADRGDAQLGTNGPQPPPATYPRQQPETSLQGPDVQAPSSGIQLPPGNPPLALEGYCPVQLQEKQRWVMGNRRWGLRHRGQTYLFAGPEEQSRFYADPDRYAPVLSGNDPVVAVEEGRMVPGRRKHGAWFPPHGRVYLFTDEVSFKKFEADPYRYVNALQQSASEVARRQYDRITSPPFNSTGPIMGPRPRGRY